MSGLAFFDTNVLTYAADRSAPGKQETAIQLVAQVHRAGNAMVSLQVLQEYYAVATKKLRVPPDIAQRNVEMFATFHVVRIQESDVLAAIALHRKSQISFWDAMIILAAQLGGAETLYTEDLQNGSKWGAVTVVNPFQS